jgi:hypothetical protein
MNEKDIEEKAEQFEAALEGLMCAMEELRKDRDRLKKLAERPRGRWVPVTNGRGGNECTECGWYAPSYQSGAEWLANYCPHCGAKMEEEE